MNLRQRFRFIKKSYIILEKHELYTIYRTFTIYPPPKILPSELTGLM